MREVPIMPGRNLLYFLHEGLVNVVRHGFMSFAAVGTTAACLLIMGTFSLLAVNADSILHRLETENEILAYVDESYTDEDTLALKAELEKIPDVLRADFISKEEAVVDFAAQYPEEELFQSLDPEILRDRYSIHIVNIERISQISEAIRSLPGIVKVNAYEDVAGGFVTLRNITSLVSLVLIALLFVVSVFITANTIKLTTLDRRDEIAIMRMVGATNAFIRWPFVVEGAFLGGLSALVAYALQTLIYNSIANGVTRNDLLKLLRIVPYENLSRIVLTGFLLSGLLIGVGGSLSAIRKYLEV